MPAPRRGSARAKPRRCVLRGAARRVRVRVRAQRAGSGFGARRVFGPGVSAPRRVPGAPDCGPPRLPLNGQNGFQPSQRSQRLEASMMVRHRPHRSLTHSPAPRPASSRSIWRRRTAVRPTCSLRASVHSPSRSSARPVERPPRPPGFAKRRDVSLSLCSLCPWWGQPRRRLMQRAGDRSGAPAGAPRVGPGTVRARGRQGRQACAV